MKLAGERRQYVASRRGNYKQVYTKCSQKFRREMKKAETGQKEKEIISGKTESVNQSDEFKKFRNCWYLL